MPVVTHAAPLITLFVLSADVSPAGLARALSVVWMLTMTAGLTLLSAALSLDVPRTTVLGSPTLARRTLTMTGRVTRVTATALHQQ